MNLLMIQWGKTQAFAEMKSFAKTSEQNHLWLDNYDHTASTITCIMTGKRNKVFLNGKTATNKIKTYH